MDIAMVLPGLHRTPRGAETALEALASELADHDGVSVTLFGSGQPRPGTPYSFVHVGAIDRQRFEKLPKLPALRGAGAYEELTYTAGLLWRYRPDDFDVTVACSYPFVNWFLTRRGGADRPAHVYITENSDWPAVTDDREARFFRCDGLVCTNPIFHDRNVDAWHTALIPNGIAVDHFRPLAPDRERFDLPSEAPLVLMVSALTPYKRTADAIPIVAAMKGTHLVVAGDGALRSEIDALGWDLMGDRYHRLSVPHAEMPALYASADVVLHMALDEPFGNVYIEAMAAGRPVVGHRNRSTKWIMGDADQGLVDTQDAAAVQAALTRALATPRDHWLPHAAACAERFAWRTVSADYLTFLEGVVARRNEPART